MDKNAVISFFDECASNWDNNMIKNSEVISKILDIAEIKSGANVLDVACGTGVLFKDYISRGVRSLTAIDISGEMVKIAKAKFPDIDVIEGDAESYQFKTKFDSIVIYNAFPHFVNDNQLFENLSQHLSASGRLTVAHGMSREAILACHKNKAKPVSKELMTAKELAEKMRLFVNVDTVISNSQMYVVSGSTPVSL